MDFGLARRIEPSLDLEDETTTGVTQQGVTPGTLAYMSPEQIRGEELDARSDLFSVAVVLYEMLAGFNPFKKETFWKTASGIAEEDPTPLTRHTDNVPQALEQIISQLLAKRPDERLPSAGELRTRLEELRDQFPSKGDEGGIAWSG